ncbi:DUF397 domain-containing protein [Amycolatopsis antarctica]|uniref:DUF397 domain-containing protein n=1 Tax=Amycolatopsis antarctica TaxID=1854586 RepID=A0A263D457_9PSEU|nr:DUF397 domain-containing protein [Amycolatopsis antarctica]
MARLTWRKSSYSGSSGNGDCVEVALTGTAAHVRDTKDRGAGSLTTNATAWHAFLTRVAGR